MPHVVHLGSVQSVFKTVHAWSTFKLEQQQVQKKKKKIWFQPKNPNWGSLKARREAFHRSFEFAGFRLDPLPRFPFITGPAPSLAAALYPREDIHISRAMAIWTHWHALTTHVHLGHWLVSHCWLAWSAIARPMDRGHGSQAESHVSVWTGPQLHPIPAVSGWRRGYIPEAAARSPQGNAVAWWTV